jgi:hypothetical protein
MRYFKRKSRFILSLVYQQQGVRSGGHFKLWMFTVSRGFVGRFSDGWPGIAFCAPFRMLAGWPTVGSLVVGQIENGKGGIVWRCKFAAGAGFGTNVYLHVWMRLFTVSGGVEHGT